MTSWTNVEFASLDLHDKRLNQRFEQVFSALNNNPGKPITQCFQTHNEIASCYRFFNNPYLKTNDFFLPHRTATINRIKEQKVVLCINDTSSLDYTTKSSIEDLGLLEASSRRGLFLHPLIAISSDRIPLGTLHVNFWKREGVNNRETTCGWTRIVEPIEKKESFRWLIGYREACRAAEECPDTQMVYLADREGDIMELFVEAQNKKASNLPIAELIIRSRHNRLLDDPDQGKKLHEQLQESPVLGKVTYKLNRKGKKSREVSQTIKACKVTFHVKRSSKSPLPPVTLNAVLAYEDNPPKDETRIVWVLLTTLPIENFEDAKKVICYYTYRWEIELFFKVLKSGLNVEQRGLKTASKLELMLVLFIIIAYRVMATCMISRFFPELPCTVLFTDMEWKAAWSWSNRKKPIPKKTPLLKEIYQIVARMGGYMSSKTRSPPGYIVTWRGLTRLQDILEGWETHEDYTCFMEASFDVN